MKRTKTFGSILAVVLSLIMILGMTMIASAAEDVEEGTAADTGFTTYAFAETDNGWLMGCQEDSTFMFKGIKYGEAERFMPAQEPEPWPGVVGALAYGNTCPNGSEDVSISAFVDPLGPDMVPSEDCLYLNVWTQSLDPDAKKPVIFFLHGGGLASGASS